MIVSDKYKLVFITTPKSGSHTGFKLMEKYFEATPTRFNHSRVIPKQYRDYYSFTFVRNPYDRFCALYHACIVNDRKPWIPGKVHSVVQYAEWLLKNENKIREDLTSSQWYWHRYSKIKDYIQIEKAEDIFQTRYPLLDIQLPHELKREHIQWNDIKTTHLNDLVIAWAEKDFGLYGYEISNC